MKKTHLIILYAVIIALIAAVIYYRESRHLVGPDKVSPVMVNDFAACAAAGFPVQESYPPRCVGPDGRTFTKAVPPPDELSPAASDDLSDLIRVTAPASNALIANPLVISGEARGSWFFEASFPARLEDANGQVLAQAPVMAQGEWMTDNFVTFAASLGYTKPTTTTGRLILEKDNPSGLEKNARQLIIPVRFE